MLVKSVDTLTSSNIPYFCRSIERTRDDSVSLCAKVQRYNFSLVTPEGNKFLAGLHIPKLGAVIHRSSCEKISVRIEREANYLALVTLQSSQTLTGSCVPNFRSFVKRSCRDSIPILLNSNSQILPVWIIETEAVDNIFVSFQSPHFVAGFSVPDFTGPIVASSDKLITVFVKSAVC